MHRDRTTVHQDAPYAVGVALGPDLRREERDKELAIVGWLGGPRFRGGAEPRASLSEWCIFDAPYGLVFVEMNTSNVGHFFK